jgi:oligopeptide/dipeptide ABC transporter ATP-binding protein
VTVQAQILEILRQLQSELGMALLLITHDLGIVAGMADRIAVMYGGRIVEEGTTDRVFESPHMPYTIGLLRAIPRLDRVEGGRLIPIRGAPAEAAGETRFCRFAPRCSLAQSICREQPPALQEIALGHRVACHFASDVPALLGNSPSAFAVGEPI